MLSKAGAAKRQQKKHPYSNQSICLATSFSKTLDLLV